MDLTKNSVALWRGLLWLGRDAGCSVKEGEFLEKMCKRQILDSHMQFATCQSDPIGQNTDLSGEAG